ncbi:2702_t:CDS:2 [Acaulospora morrowiae]|uniref:2702_t:CDS:1 n=1 Tax=Acaulospora morrowiae TaxID=94023 RepID=A0A9N9DYX4_9GLOM|nr:2702_t:CDS:2 [Acaulospora morrowiae]
MACFKNICFVLLINYLGLYNLAYANVEKEIFSSNLDGVSQSVYKKISEWSTHKGLVTLISPYAIQRYERIVPFRNIEEFSDALTGEKENWYVIDGLEEGSTYEARISYAATSPTTFVLEIMGFEDAARILRKRNVLQDHESTSELRVFTTKKLIRVRAIYDGVSITPNRDSQVIIYNIVLENLIYGIPRVAFKLIFLLGVTMGAAYFLFVPKIYNALRKVVEEKEKKE